MYSRFLLFITLFIAVIIGANLLIYSSLVYFLSINSLTIRLYLFIFLFGFVFLFFGTSIALHFYNRVFLHQLYLLAAVWAGIWVYLFFGALFAWLAAAIFQFSGNPPPLTIISAVYLFVVGLISIYGLWNAHRPRIKDIKATIKNLPPAWKNKTAVQLSDLHLGSIYGPVFLKIIVKQVNALKPDLIFITGDLFDGVDGELDCFTSILNELKAKKGIFFINGNHEQYLGLEKVRTALKETNIPWLEDQVINLGGLQIIGLKYGPDAIPRENIIETVRNNSDYKPGEPTILLYHAPGGIKEAQALGVNLQLSGHTHRGQLFPFNYITQLVFKGFDYGWHRIGDYAIYITTGVGTWGPPMRVGNQPEIVRIELL